MRKNTAEAVANEMAAQGYKPILAHATRDTGIKTWEVWGTDPDTLASVMVATREEWDQHVSDKAHANAVDYCAEHFTGAVSVLAVELADAIKRAEAAEAKLALVDEYGEAQWHSSASGTEFEAGPCETFAEWLQSRV